MFDVNYLYVEFLQLNRYTGFSINYYFSVLKILLILVINYDMVYTKFIKSNPQKKKMLF